MTMEEMARIIGVSRITLSKVMNDKEGVSEKTRERVKEYIKKYNFEPNSQARSLVGKRSRLSVSFYHLLRGIQRKYTYYIPFCYGTG